MNVEDISDRLIKKDGIWYSNNNKAISYPKTGNSDCFVLEDSSFWFKHRNNCIIRALERFKKDGIFLDVGGGNGYVSFGIKRIIKDVILLEPGIEGALNAKKRGIENIICSSLAEANIKSNIIDNIGIFDVLEHIEDDKKFLNDIKLLLKNSGKLFITVPAYRLLWSQEDILAGHFRRYNLKSLCKLLKKSGFKINYATYFFSMLPFPVFIFRTIPYRLGRKKSNSKEEHKSKKGFLGKILNFILTWEEKMVTNKIKICFGGSCLIVAEK